MRSARQIPQLCALQGSPFLGVGTPFAICFSQIPHIYADRSHTVPQSGVGGGVGWGINVHVHVHTSSTLISHLSIFDDTSATLGVGGVGWGSYVHGWGGMKSEIPDNVASLSARANEMSHQCR